MPSIAGCNKENGSRAKENFSDAAGRSNDEKASMEIQ
jgi:hypothetical protein